MNVDEIKKGFKMGFPVVIGYAPVAATFGLICKSGGFSLFETFAFLIFCFCWSKSVYGSKSYNAWCRVTGEVLFLLFSSKLKTFSYEFCNK